MTKKKYKPKVILSIHGFISRGKWQKTLSKVLSAIGIPSYSYDYGYYKMILFKRANNKLVDKFYEEYNDIINDRSYALDLNNIEKRPSIVAHSLGTWILGSALNKYTEMKFDKIILCGCILPSNFDWDNIFERDQVNFVRHEIAKRDFPVRLAKLFVRRAGDSGRNGFDTESVQLIEEEFKELEHGEFFSETHIRTLWLPFLKSEPYNLKGINGKSLRSIATFEEYFAFTLQIDREYFGNFPDYLKIEVKIPDALEWIKINPDIYTFLINDKTKRIVGYINAMPVTDQLFKKALSGNLKDNEIKSNDILPFHKTLSKVKLLILSIAIDKSVRDLNVGLINNPMENLLRTFNSKFIDYARRYKIKITEICAVAWTSEGKRLCEIYKMKEVAKDIYENPVYYINLTDPAVIENKNVPKELKNLLKNY